MKIIIACLCLVSVSATAQQVNKCQIDGKTVYQHAPCKAGATANKLSIKDDAPPKEVVEAQRERLFSYAKSVENDHQLNQLNRDINTEESNIRRYQRSMDIEIDSLQNKKKQSRNNLAGATWEQSISSEMSAIAEKYQTKIKVSQDRLEHLRKEKASLMDSMKK